MTVTTREEAVRRKFWIIPAVLSVALAGTAYGAEVTNVSPTGHVAAGTKPNIVFVLTDDLSMNLIKHMSAVRAMRRGGTSFDNYYVADGLCCPSRSTILTGRFPHNTGVTTNKNEQAGGGYQAFVKHGNPKRTYAVPLDQAGYRTGFFGKFLNGYDVDKHPVPPGWDEWTVASNGYSEIAGSYRITNVHHKGAGKHITKPDSYLTDYVGGAARDFTDRAHNAHQPFFLQLSTFAPHGGVSGSKTEPRFPPALRDRPGHEFKHGDCGVLDGKRVDCDALHVKRGTGLSEDTYRELDRDLRNRVRMVQSVNDQMIALRKHLADTGQLDDTYFVFSSDNGFHLGEHGLLRGKGTAYDHDTNVPLVVTGPGVKRGQVRHVFAQNTDLYPTFLRMAHLEPAKRDGHSLVGLLGTESPGPWRDGVLYEHQGREGPSVAGFDPDAFDGDTAARKFLPSAHTYNAVRTEEWLYVEYANGRHELYHLTSDAGQNHNVYRSHPQVADRLHKWLRNLHTCGKPGKPSCWSVANR
jgi:arylsulfatase A-like enzyme